MWILKSIQPVSDIHLSYIMQKFQVNICNNTHKTYVPSMIPSAILKVLPVAITIIASKLFCEILESGDGRTDVQTTRAKIVNTTGQPSGTIFREDQQVTTVTIFGPLNTNEVWINNKRGGWH